MKMRELRQLVKFCQQNGLKSLKFGEIELTFAEKPAKQETSLPPPDKEGQMPSDSDMLFYSSQGLPIEDVEDV